MQVDLLSSAQSAHALHLFHQHSPRSIIAAIFVMNFYLLNRQRYVVMLRKSWH